MKKLITAAVISLLALPNITLADTPNEVHVQTINEDLKREHIKAMSTPGGAAHTGGVGFYDATDTLIGIGSVYADNTKPVQTYVFVPSVNAYAHFLLYDSSQSSAEIGSINNYYETFVTDNGELASNYPNQLIYLEGCDGIDGTNGKWYKSANDPIVETTVGFYHQSTPDEACTFHQKSHPRLVFKLIEVSPDELPFGKNLNMPITTKPYIQ